MKGARLSYPKSRPCKNSGARNAEARGGQERAFVLCLMIYVVGAMITVMKPSWQRSHDEIKKHADLVRSFLVLHMFLVVMWHREDRIKSQG